MAEDVTAAAETEWTASGMGYVSGGKINTYCGMNHSR